MVHPKNQKQAHTLVVSPPFEIKTYDIMFGAAEAQCILAAKFFNYNKFVHAVTGNGDKLRVDYREINGMRWCITGQTVVIPDEFF